jgi:hypothetical protein
MPPDLDPDGRLTDAERQVRLERDRADRAADEAATLRDELEAAQRLNIDALRALEAAQVDARNARNEAGALRDRLAALENTRTFKLTARSRRLYAARKRPEPEPS